MATELKQRFDRGDKTAKVFYDTEFDEYVVKFYAGGFHMDASDYLTDDEDDAVRTAREAVEAEDEWANGEANNLAG